VRRSITEHDVRNRLRRGQRMQEAGRSPAEVVRRGGLAVSWVGRRRYVSLASVMESIADDPLALDVLGDILDGRIAVPRAGVADLYELV
jgi:hypothetical protein